MSTLGNSFEESVALMVGAGEQMPNQSGKIARGLRSIGLEISKQAKTSSTLATGYNGVTVALKDQDGSLRSTYDILSDLYLTWQKMTDAQKSALGISVAGKTQYEVFAATMNGFNNVLDAYDTAMVSAGSATQENSKYMESLEAKTQLVKKSWNDLITKTLNSNSVSNVLDMASGFLKLASNMDSIIPLLGIFLSMPITKTLGAIVSGIKNVITALVQGTITIQTVTGGIGLLLTAISAVVTGFEAYKASQRQAMKDASQAAQTTLTQVSALRDLKTEYENILDSTDDESTKSKNLTELKKKLVEQYGFEKDAIDKVTTSRKDGILAIQQETQAQITAGIADIADEYNKANQKLNESQRTVIGMNVSPLDSAVNSLKQYGLAVEENADGTQTLAIEASNLDQQYTQLTSALAYLQTKQDKGIELTDGEEQAYGYLSSQLETMKTDYDSWTSVRDSYNALQAQSVINSNLESTALVDSAESFAKYKESLLEANNRNKEFNEALSLAIDSLFPEYSSSMENINVSTEDFEDSEESLGNQVDTAKAQFEALNNALNDYQNYNGLTQSSIEALISTFPGLLDGLYNEDGSLTAVGKSALSSSDNFWNFIIAQKQAAITAAQTNFENLKSELKTVGDEAYSAAQNLVLLKSISSTKKTIDEAQADLQKLTSLKSLYSKSSSSGGSSRKSSGSSTSSSATKKDPIAEQSKAFKEQIDILEHKLFLQEQIEGTEQAQISIQKQIQKELNQQANWFRSKGLSNNSEYIRDLQKQWWQYADSIAKINTQIQENIREEQTKTLEAIKDIYDRHKTDMETSVNYLSSIIQKEIGVLEKRKETIESKAQAEIDVLNAENEAIDEQITLQEKLSNLAAAKAKRKFVYKDGSFQYVQDIDAISAAQSDLDAYNREQKLKEATQQIEEDRDRQINAIDKIITQWQNYEESFTSVVDDYSTEQDRLIAEQILGNSLEKQNWDERLQNARAFASEYKNALAALNQSESSLSTISSGGSLTDSEIRKMMAYNSAAWHTAATQADKDALHEANKQLNSMLGNQGSFDTSSGKWEYATGTTNARGGLSLVGEQGAEMRVLNSGDGIIPSKLTSNLMSLGQYSPLQWFSQLKGNVSKAMSSGTNISVANITLPNVSNAQEFISGLKNLAYQYSTQRV